MGFHSKASIGARHPLPDQLYANSTARLAATGFTVDDVWKAYGQEDDGSLWLLTDYSPITWVELTSTGGDLSDYLLIDGTRAMTGSLDMGASAITNVGNVDGRDVSADGSTLDSHVANTSNPHSVNLSNIGAGTLASLNSAVTDATLDTSTAARPPLITSASHGDIIVRNASEWVRLAAGISGQLLQTNGAAAVPSWVTAPANGDVVGPASATDNAIVRYDGATGKLVQNSGITISDTGVLDLGNNDAIDAKTITFDSVNTATPSSGTITCEFDEYQKIIADLNNVATVTIQLNVPAGPANFMLEVVQGGSSATTSLTWATEGTHALYAPGGSIDIQSGTGEITLVPLFYDGSKWFATAVPVEEVLAN